jgi:hypothetical protein
VGVVVFGYFCFQGEIIMVGGGRCWGLCRLMVDGLFLVFVV